MAMTIEELIDNLTTIRNKICPGKYETETSLTFNQTLAALHKYQKIEQIVNEYNLQLCNNTSDGAYNFQRIREVIEDEPTN